MFLADFDGGPIVRAVKALGYVSPSGIHGGTIVTVGPFREEDEGNPAPTSRTSSASWRWST